MDKEFYNVDLLKYEVESIWDGGCFVESENKEILTLKWGLDDAKKLYEEWNVSIDCLKFNGDMKYQDGFYLFIEKLCLLHPSMEI